MRPVNSWSRRRTGVLGLVSLALVGCLVVLISISQFGERTYYADLQTTGGIRSGEEVQIAGVPQGSVTSVALVGQHVRIGFTVSSGVHLGDQTQVQVKVATLLGTHFLKVLPAGAGELPGDTVPMAQTSVPFNIQNAIDTVTPKLEQLDTVKIARSMQVLADVIDQAAPQLGPAVDGVRRVSGVIARRADQFGQLLSATDTVSAKLAQNTPEVITLMNQGRLVLDELRARRAAIHALLANATTLATSLRGILQDNRAQIGPLLADLQTTVDNLRTHARVLGEAVDQLALASRYFTNAMGNGPWVDLSFGASVVPDNPGCHLKGRC